MNREETIKAIEVMQAYVDGAEIEAIDRYIQGGWRPAERHAWAWNDIEYRVKQTADFIDWSHVAPEYKWLARDEDGSAYLFTSEPYLSRDTAWDFPSSGEFLDAIGFSSYKRGTVDWKDSLVKRPDDGESLS